MNQSVNPKSRHFYWSTMVSNKSLYNKGCPDPENFFTGLAK